MTYDSLTTPSGRVFSAQEQDLVLRMADAGVLRYSDEPFLLKSGIESHVYVFGRNDITDNPQLEWDIGKKIVDAMTDFYREWPDYDVHRRHCLIGIPTAGTALAQAVAMVALRSRIYSDRVYLPTHHRVMREQRKTHGAHHGWVDGDVDPSVLYWTVDNVVTDGGSKWETMSRLREDGYPVASMPSIVFIDRQQGGVARMERMGGGKILVVFHLYDLAWVLYDHKVWSKEVLGQIDREIHAHQFK